MASTPEQETLMGCLNWIDGMESSLLHICLSDATAQDFSRGENTKEVLEIVEIVETDDDIVSDGKGKGSQSHICRLLMASKFDKNYSEMPRPWFSRIINEMVNRMRPPENYRST